MILAPNSQPQSMPMPAPPGQNIYSQQYQGPPQGPYAPPGAANYPASHAGYHQQNYNPAQNYHAYRPPGPPAPGGYYPGYGQPQQ